MKIALVAQHTTLLDRRDTSSDPERIRLAELASQLAGNGHQVTVYAQKLDPGLPARGKLPAGARVEHLGPASDGPAGDGPAGDGTARDGRRGRPADERELLARVPAFTAPLRGRLSEDRPDVVHALRWTSGLAALAASRGLGIPVVQSFHSLGIAERRRHMLRQVAGPERMRLEPAIGRGANAVLADSTDEESDLTRLGVPRRSIKVVPCGIDTDEFAPEGPVASRNGRPRLVTVADMEETSALDTLLHAMVKVPGAELIVAGGPPRDELHRHPEHARRCALAHALGLNGRVLFTGHVATRRLPPLLRSADLFVSTAEYEPSAMLSLQAMACGTPVVAPAVGSQLDAVVDGTTGILVPPAQPALLAHRIRQLLAHPMLLEAFSAAATDRVRSRYSWNRIAHETIAVYESLDAAAKAAA
jgi:glycosyltransferase involved in cell wall biosynthesis